MDFLKNACKALLFLFIYSNLNTIAHGKDCIYIKKIECLNNKILHSYTEYNCTLNDKPEKKPLKKVIVTPLKNNNIGNYINSLLMNLGFAKEVVLDQKLNQKFKRQPVISFNQIRNTALGY